MNLEEINAMTVDALKTKLSELKLPTAAKRANLQNRLIEHFGLEDDEGSDNDFSSTILEPSRVTNSFFLHCETFKILYLTFAEPITLTLISG